MRSLIANFSVVFVFLAFAGCSTGNGEGTASGGSSNGGQVGNSGTSATTGGTHSMSSGGSTSLGGSANPGSGGAKSGGAGGTSSSTGGTSGNSGGVAGTAGSGNASSGGSSGGANTSGGSGGSSPNGGTSAGGTAGGGIGAAGGGGATNGGGGAGGRPACTPPYSYRNLFTEVLSKSDADAQAKLDAGYQALFHGSSNNVYYESGSDEAYILDVNNNDVRSEGISYGMMISVQMDKKEEFNRLWKFAKQHMAMSGGNAGLFNWKTSTSGQVTGNGSAPDGEEYFATALIFASKRWGDGSGIFNYSSEAKTVLDAMANKGLFNSSNHIVQFLQNTNYTDPSYVLPAFYEVWSCFDTKNQSFWKSAVSAGRTLLQKTTDKNTGLAPYLANFDGTPNGSQSKGTQFQSDPWRVVGNIMMDYHFFGADPWQATFAATYAAFFAKAWAMAPYGDEFQLNGTATNTNADVSKGLAAQNALVGFGVPASAATVHVQRLWDMQIPTGQYRYYDGMLYMLAFLHASGHFHLYY